MSKAQYIQANKDWLDALYYDMSTKNYIND